MGVIQDITSATRLRPWPAVVVQAIFGGLAAIGYAYASMRRLWLLPLVFLFQIGGAIEVSRLVQSFWAGGVRAAVVSLEAIEARMMADGIAVILLIALGYTFFIVTIVREGGGFARLKAGGAGG